MAQAGIYCWIGTGVCKWVPVQEWLMLGIILGNLLLDADMLAVAVVRC
jgi:predicted Na+-dependent transporter